MFEFFLIFKVSNSLSYACSVLEEYTNALLLTQDYIDNALLLEVRLMQSLVIVLHNP